MLDDGMRAVECALEVAIDDGVEKILGIAQGIDEFGRLLVLTDRGIKYVSAGDVSVRPI